MDTVTAIVGFLGGGVSVGGLLLLKNGLRPKREAERGQKITPAVPQHLLSELTADQRELVRLKAIDEGKAIGREEARQELEKLQTVQSELVEQKAYSAGYSKGREDGLASYIIDIQPFYKKKSVFAIGFKRYEYTFGYNYQLFVNSMPCFDPFERVIKTETDTQIDADELEKRVQGLMESVVSGAANGLIGNLRVGKLIEKK